MTDRSAVVLLSGGLDSSTVLAIAADEGFALHAISFRYGQRHAIELDAAREIASRAGVRQHVEAEIDLRHVRRLGAHRRHRGPEGTGAGGDVRRHPDHLRARSRTRCSSPSPLAWAEVLGADDIFMGVNALDYSGYPDCRPEYIAAYEQMANLATKRGVEGHRLTIHTPADRSHEGPDHRAWPRTRRRLFPDAQLL